MLGAEEIFSYVCVCPSFKLDVLSDTLKDFDSTKEILPYELLLITQSLSNKDYIEYDRDFAHYNIRSDKAKDAIPKLENKLFCELHETWANAYGKYLVDLPDEFGEAGFVSLLYHKAIRTKQCEQGKKHNMLDYLKKTAEADIRRLCEKGYEPSISRIVRRMNQLNLLDEMLSPDAKADQKEFIDFLYDLRGKIDGVE